MHKNLSAGPIGPGAPKFSNFIGKSPMETRTLLAGAALWLGLGVDDGSVASWDSNN